MDCENFGKYLDNYESLTEQEKSDMNEHAAKCEECRAELDFFLSMISTARSLPKADPPSDFMDKLNARLDAEDKRVVSASGIIGHFHRYGMRYAAAAACLALVAVITANRSLLTGQMDNVPDGVIREETTVSDGSVHDGQSTPLPSAVTPSLSAVDNSAQPSAAPQTSGGTVTASATQTSAPAPRRSSAVSAPRTDTFVPASAPQAASAPAEAIGETRSIPAPDENAQTDSPAPVSEPDANIGGEPAEISTTPIMQRSVPEQTEQSEYDAPRKSYSIALASIVGSSDEPEVYDLRPEEVSESLKPSEIQANYSLADEGDIARGKYSKLNRDGIPIESATAIGSLKFRADDEERALDVINRYTVDEENNIYTTDSANLRLILSRLSSEGIEYTDYTVSGSGEVKFRIEFN